MCAKRLRQAMVAGYFYPKDPALLRQTLRELTEDGLPRTSSMGAIVPHGGFQFSGAIAGETFSRLSIPRRCVVLGPNHTGLGSPWSLMAEGAYQTPLGEVPVDVPLATALLEACPLLRDDEQAHLAEHAIEMALPFLQWLGPEALAIVPLVIGSEDVDECEQVAGALARVIRQSGEPGLVVASADFNHYEPREVTASKDAQVIAAVQTLNHAQFLEQVRVLDVTMCGHGSIACFLGAMRRLGATQAHLIRYGTSADAGGDPHSAIGYAGMIVN